MGQQAHKPLFDNDRQMANIVRQHDVSSAVERRLRRYSVELVCHHVPGHLSLRLTNCLDESQNLLGQRAADEQAAAVGQATATLFLTSWEAGADTGDDRRRA